ncbi:MAG: Bug family tripartite tricarboxylate transporter substrate binding protein [Rhodospirillales bacterium]
MSKSFGVFVSALALAASCGVGAAQAQFYKGKTLTLLINYPPGGPTDIEGRVIAHHLPNHIPGKPTVIVKNMGGAAGNVGANYLGEAAAKDGMTLGFFTWSPLDEVLGSESLRVKYSQFIFIAGVQQPTVVYARKDVPPGINKPADIMKTSGFKYGGLGNLSTQVLFGTLSLDLLGVKYQVVTGYKGLKEVETAVQQNEVQVSSSSLPGWRASITPTMVKTGIVTPLWHLDLEDGKGNFMASPVVPDVPTFLTVYKEIKGKDAMPSGVAWESLRLIAGIMNSMFRTSFLPPGSPDEAVKDARAAFVSLWKDEKFLAEYEKTVRYRAGLVAGDEGQKIIANLATIKPELVAFLKDYTSKLGK